MKKLLLCAVLVISSIMFAQAVFAESEEEILRNAYKDFTTPIVVNSIKESPVLGKNQGNSYVFAEMTIIKFCNISDKVIKKITFSYTVYDRNYKKVYTKEVSEKNIEPFAVLSKPLKNVNMKETKALKELRRKAEEAKLYSVEIDKIDIQFAGGKKQQISKADIPSCIYGTTVDLYDKNNMKISLEYNAYEESCSITAEAPFEMSYLSCNFGVSNDDAEEEKDDDLENGEEIVDIEDSDVISSIKTTKSERGYKSTILISASDVVFTDGVSVEYVGGSAGKNEKIFIDNAGTLQQINKLAEFLELVL